MNIIFLDIDGVLINRQYASRGVADPSCISALNELTEATGAKIVLSTSWRHRGYELVKKVLEAWGVTGEIFSATGGYRDTREEEIQDWLDKFGNGIDNFVIVDDEGVGDLSKHHVCVDFEVGLTRVHAIRANNILFGLDQWHTGG